MSANGQFLYAASFSSGAVHIFNTATKAQVGLVVAPSGAAIDVQLSADETSLYLASYSTNRVWRYTGSGATWIQDFTFDGDGELAVPATVEGIAVDGNGNIYTTAYGGGAVYKYDAVTQTTSLLLSTLTDFGLQPIGVEIGPDNKLYIGTFSGAGTNKLLRYNLNGTKDATLATPGVFASGLDFPITVDFKLIPEPASLTLLALGGFALLRRRFNSSR
jgi:DNA-binding beta-propeller fold protein YncE